MAEYQTAAGETIELHEERGVWIVDCWDKNNESRWSRQFTTEEQAQAEFKRWEYLK